MTAAQTFVTREIARLGETHPDVALARGMLATGYAKAGRDAEALAEFRKSVPALLAAKRATDVDESAVLALRNSLIRNIVESYAGVLVRSKKDGGEDTESSSLPADRRRARACGAPGGDGLHRPHGGARQGARRPRAQRAGPGKADRRAPEPGQQPAGACAR